MKLIIRIILVALFGNSQYTKNILGEIAYMGYKTTHKINFQGNFIIGHKLDFITKGLKVEGMFSYDIEETHAIDRSIPRQVANNESYGGYATSIQVTDLVFILLQTE